MFPNGLGFKGGNFVKERQQQTYAHVLVACNKPLERPLDVICDFDDVADSPQNYDILVWRDAPDCHDNCRPFYALSLISRCFIKALQGSSGGLNTGLPLIQFTEPLERPDGA